MQRFVCLCVLSFLFLPSFSQSSPPSSTLKNDSLRLELRSSVDTIRWQAGYSLATWYSYKEVNEDSVFKYVSLFEKELEEQAAWSMLSDFTILKGKHLARLLQPNNVPTDRDTVFTVYRQAGQFALRAKDSLKYALCLTALATQFDRLRQMDSSTHYLLESSKIYEQSDHPRLPMNYYYLGVGFTKQKDQDMALKYRRKAWESYLRIGGKEWKVMPIAEGLALSYMHFYTEDSLPQYLDSCLKYSQIALTTAGKFKDMLMTARSTMAMAKAHLLKGDFSETLQLSQEVINLSKPGSLGKMMDLGKDLCDAYLARSEAFAGQNKWDQALVYADSAAWQANAMDWATYQFDAYQQVYRCHKALGNYKAALNALEMENEFEDSLYSVEKRAAITELENKYRAEKKEKENLQLSQTLSYQSLQLKQRNTVILLGSIAVFFAIIAVVIFIRQRNARERQKRTEIEQRLLRAQINPHFFFNVLTSLQNMILQNKPAPLLASSIGQLAKLMRQTLESSFNEFIPLEEEIGAMKNYLDLQKLRFSKEFDYEIEVNLPEDESYSIPPMIAQPLLENALEHGIKHLDTNGKIEISLFLENSQLMLSVKDNGIGLEQSAALAKSHKNHISRAGQITRERLQLLNPKGNFFFQLRDRMVNGHIGGTEARVALPFST